MLIHIEEAVWGGNKAAASVLKSFITDETVATEKKNQAILNTRNFRKIIVTSNDSRPVNLEIGDRRMVVLHASDCHVQDQSYFGAIQDQLDDGGYAALMNDLLTEDLDGFSPEERPVSRHSWEMKLHSMSPVGQFFYNLLYEADDEQWTSEIAVDAFHRLYRDFADESGLPRISSNVLGIELRKVFENVAESRPRRAGGRIRCYVFPRLPTLRGDFQIWAGEGEEIWNE